MNALHPDIHASLKDLSDALGITSRFLSQTSFLLTIPVCFESLTWQVSFAQTGASCTCADILVPDEHFAPLLRSEKVLTACINAHDAQHKGLTHCVEELLAWWATCRTMPYVSRQCLPGHSTPSSGQEREFLHAHEPLRYCWSASSSWLDHVAMRSISDA